MMNRFFRCLVLMTLAFNALVYPLITSAQFEEFITPEEEFFYEEEWGQPVDEIIPFEEEVYGEETPIGEGEIIEMRDQYTKVYPGESEEFLAEIAIEPQHYFDGESWQDIETNWRQEGEGNFSNDANEVISTISSEDRDTVVINLTKRGNDSGIRINQMYPNVTNEEGEVMMPFEFGPLEQASDDKLMRTNFDGSVQEVALNRSGISQSINLSQELLEIGDVLVEEIEIIGEVDLKVEGESAPIGESFYGAVQLYDREGDRIITITAPSVAADSLAEPISGTLKVLQHDGGVTVVQKSLPLSNLNNVFPIAAISTYFYPSFNYQNGYATSITSLSNTKHVNGPITTGLNLFDHYRGWMHWNLSFIPSNIQSVSDPTLTVWPSRVAPNSGNSVSMKLYSMEKDPTASSVSASDILQDAQDGTLYKTITVNKGVNNVSADLTGAGNKIKSARLSGQTWFAIGTKVDDLQTFVDFESYAQNTSSSHIPKLLIGFSTSPTGGNQPPATPTLTYPSSGATISTTTPSLTANISDADGDKMIARFFLSTTPDPFSYGSVCSQSGQTNGSVGCQVSLAKGTKHYWGVSANDGNSADVKSQVFSFTTSAGATPGPNPNPNPGNSAPYANASSPLDGASIYGSQVELKALINDADGDSMSGSFYMTDSGGDPFSTGQKCTFSNESNGAVVCQQSISNGKTYKWGVKIKDSQSTLQSSKVFTFKASSTPIKNPPAAPTNLSPTNSSTFNQPQVELKWKTFDQDGDKMKSFVYISDTADPFNNSIGYYPVSMPSESGGTKSHTALNLKPGTYYWGVVTLDDAGNQSSQSAINKFTINDRTTSPNSRRQGVQLYGTREYDVATYSHLGDPVTLHSGEFTYSLPVFNLPGNNLPLDFNIHYRSQTNFDGVFGYNWDHNFNKRIVDDGLSATFYDGMGTQMKFISNPDGSYQTPQGYFDKLVKTSTGYQVTKPGNVVLDFDLDGNFTKYTDRYGNNLTFQHDAQGKLISVTETRGKKITFSYDQLDRINRATDWAGRAFSFTYDANGEMTVITTPTTPEFPQGLETKFTYSSGNPADQDKLNHNILTVTDPKGQVFVQNTYDSNDRVSQQVNGNGTIKYAYTLNSSDQEVDVNTVTDANGNVTKFTFDRIGHITKKETLTRGLQPGASASYITTYKYNDDGKMIEERKQRGNGIRYTYDSTNPQPHLRGNLLEVRQMENVDVAANDAKDIVTQFTYDAVYSQLIKVIDPNGNTITNTLDSKGNVIKSVLPSSTNGDGSSKQLTVTRTFDANGKVLSEKDSTGREMKYVYNADHFLSQTIQDPAGTNRITSFTYDQLGNITTITDPTGKTTTLTVDNLNLVKAIKTNKPFNYEVRQSYDKALNLIKTQVKNIDENGNAVSAHPWINTTHEYDLLNRPTKTTQEMGTGNNSLTNEVKYDGNGNVVKTIEGGIVTTDIKYDERDLPIEITKAAGKPEVATSKVQYDVDGQIVKTIDPRGNVSDIHYDLFNRNIGAVDSLGNVMRYELDKNGNITRSEKVEGQGNKNPARELRPTTGVVLDDLKFKYNQNNQLIQKDEKFFTTVGLKTIVDGPLTPNDGYVTTQISYNEQGEVVKIVDDKKNTTTFNYDKLGQLTKKTDAMGNISELVYDKAGRVITKKDTEKKLISGTDVFTNTYAYDEASRLLSSSNSLNEKTSWKYDSRNNRTLQIDPEGNIAKYEYDPASRLVSQVIEYRQGGIGSGTLLNSARTNFYYGPTSMLEAVEDPNGLVTNNVYDRLNRVIKTVDALGGETLVKYDKSGNTTEITQPTGTKVFNVFDQLNRLTKRTVTKGTNVKGHVSETFEYDGMSRMTKADNSAATMRLGYDSMNNTVQEKGGLQDMDAIFDGLGNEVETVYPGKNSVYHQYDALNRLSSTKLNNTNLVTQYFDGTSRLNTKVLKNGMASTYAYDKAKRLTGVGHYIGTTISQGFGYEYNKAGILTSETFSHLSNKGNRYEYDSAYQLTKAYELATDATKSGQGAIQTYEWNYDKNNNRTTQKIGANTNTYQINELNAYKSVDQTTHNVDANGNLHDDGNLTYYYNFLNQLVEVYDKSAKRTLSSFEYDALGRRVKRTVHGDTAATTKVYQYVYQGNQVMYEETYVNGTRTEYRYNYYTQGMDSLYMYNSNNIEYTLAANNLGSIVGVYDNAGKLLERYEYSPFGDVKAYDGAGQSITPGSVSGNRRFFNGKEYDEEIGLYYYHARYYSPKLGRFIQKDPLGFADGMNPFAYVGNSPVSFVDPLGLEKVLVAMNRGLVDPGVLLIRSSGDNNDNSDSGPNYIDQGLEFGGDVLDAVSQVDWWQALDGAGQMLQGGVIGGVSIAGGTAACAGGGALTYGSGGTLVLAGAEACAFGATAGAAGATYGAMQFSQGMDDLSDSFDDVQWGGSSSGYNSVDNLIDSVGEFEKLSSGKLQGFAKGNAKDVYNQLIKNGTKGDSGAYKLANDIWVMLYNSSTSGAATIMIDKSAIGGAIYKIRF